MGYIMDTISVYKISLENCEVVINLFRKPNFKINKNKLQKKKQKDEKSNNNNINFVIKECESRTKKQPDAIYNAPDLDVNITKIENIIDEGKNENIDFHVENVNTNEEETEQEEKEEEDEEEEEEE